MDQSGPRYQGLKSPLIERSDLQTSRQRTLYGVLTLGFWAFWIYLWVPLLALLAWALGVDQAYKFMVVQGGYHAVLKILGIYGLIILLLGGALVLWAVYNILRFGGVENRTAALPVTPAEIGRHFGQDPASVMQWQYEQRLYVTHDPKGGIASVEALSNGAPVPA